MGRSEVSATALHQRNAPCDSLTAGFGFLGKFVFSQRHRNFIYTRIIALLINIRAQCLEARFQYPS